MGRLACLHDLGCTCGAGIKKHSFQATAKSYLSSEASLVPMRSPQFSGTVPLAAVSKIPMARAKTALRVLRGVAFGILLAALCLVAAIPIQQRRFRWRAERLQADMQAIQLHHTSWDEARSLMNRWGAWGHYDGACTVGNCRYTITLEDMGSAAVHPDDYGKLQALIRYLLGSSPYRWLGGRAAIFETGFIVQDGAIWRTFEDIGVEVPSGVLGPEDSGYELMARAQSRSSLNREANPKAHWILGGSEPPAEHPEFKAGRPGGCEICMSVEVTYSISTAQDEIRNITSFDLSCLTRRHPCARVEDLLPAARPWHLYQLDGDPPLQEPPPGPATTCQVPVTALARDAIAVLSVDALSSSAKKDSFEGIPFEEDRVRLTGILKGSAPWAAGALLNAEPYSGDPMNPPFSLPEHLTPGRHYLLVIVYRFPELEPHYDPPPEEIAKGPGLSLDRCGVLEDTPQNRRDIQRGIGQNDQLRVSEF